jgi:hypothetical protein
VRRARLLLLSATALLTALGWPGASAAYTIGTRFGDPCHEIIAASAFRVLAARMDPIPLEVPSGGAWRTLGLPAIEALGVTDDLQNEQVAFLLVSMVLGARSIDTDGHATSELSSLRKLHGASDARSQYLHALRGPDDDGRAGDGLAVEGTRSVIRELVELAAAARAAPIGERTLTTTFYEDYYGLVEVEVMATAFYVGQAAHVVADSFSHTIRAEAHGLRRVATVFNYVDAIGPDFDEARDGMRHSDTLDLCLLPEAADLTAAATRATYELVLAALAYEQEPQALEAFLDDWISWAPECVADNDYCGSARWVELARRKQTTPYLSCAWSGRGGGGAPAGWGLLGTVLVVLFVGKCGGGPCGRPARARWESRRR